MIVRRERAHPGAQLSFTDHDGHRFQAILTDQTGPIAELERDHRGRARVEDHIRNDKDTGLRNLPFRTFAHNQVWLQIVRLAHDLIVLDPTTALDRRARQDRTQTPALPPVARRRAPRLPRPHRDAASPRRVALGRANSPPRSSVWPRFPRQPDTRPADTHDDNRTPRAARSAKRAHKPPPGPPKQSQHVRDRLN